MQLPYNLFVRMLHLKQIKVSDNLKGFDMIQNIIVFSTVMILVSLTAHAGYSQTSSGFTVTTIALDASNVYILEELSEEDANASIEGDNSEK